MRLMILCGVRESYKIIIIYYTRRNKTGRYYYYFFCRLFLVTGNRILCFILQVVGINGHYSGHVVLRGPESRQLDSHSTGLGGVHVAAAQMALAKSVSLVFVFIILYYRCIMCVCVCVCVWYYIHTFLYENFVLQCIIAYRFE